MDEAMASLAAQRKEADERRLAMADERGRLQEERLAASRAAEEARQAQLDAVKSREEALPGHPYSGWRERDHGARSTHQRPRRHKKASKGTDEPSPHWVATSRAGRRPRQSRAVPVRAGHLPRRNAGGDRWECVGALRER